MISSVRVSFGSVPPWAAVLAGLLLIVLGAVAVFQTDAVISVLVIGVSIVLAVAGLALILAGISMVHHHGTGAPFLAIGLLLLFLAGLLVLAPNIILTAMILILAVLAILLGIIVIVVGAGLGADPKYRILLAIFGLVTLIAGLYLLLYPHTSGLLLVKIGGIYAIFMGIVIIVSGLTRRGRAAPAPDVPEGFSYREIE